MPLKLNSTGGGSVTLDTPSTASAYTLTVPALTGTAVVTGSTATVSQTMLASGVAGNGPAFSAYQSSTTQNITQNVWTKVVFNQELFDTANCFDSTTNYRFTPNVAGYYQFNGSISIGTAGGMYMGIVKNGTIYQYGTNTTSGAVNFSGLINTIISMNGTTDYVEIYVAPISASITVIADVTKTWFNGALIRSA